MTWFQFGTILDAQPAVQFISKINTWILWKMHMPANTNRIWMQKPLFHLKCLMAQSEEHSFGVQNVQYSQLHMRKF